MRWSIDSSSHRIHLAVEGSVGGTTVGLHLSADVIENGGRVSWNLIVQARLGNALYIVC